MSELAAVAREDRAAREEALDTGSSILVQAPAGAGKTELLAMRILKLFAEVDEPEQVLAITFTRAAAAEMRHRVLSKLEEASVGILSRGFLDEVEQANLEIARDALARATGRGWRLLDQPQRLNIQTIDSLCLRIARQLPLSARLGGILQPTENAASLYRKAARQTLERMGGADAELNAALRALLALRDSDLANIEQLLAQMLATRDQWGRAFPLHGVVDWEAARQRLEAPFHREIERVLRHARELLDGHPEAVRELMELAAYACRNVEESSPLYRLSEFTGLPEASAERVAHWLCLCEFLMTADGRARKAYDRRQGFPPKDNGEKRRMKQLVERLGEMPVLWELLCEIRALPSPRYAEEQWQSLRHMFIALRQAVAELGLVFAAEGVVDFVELSEAALQVLGSEGGDSFAAEGAPPLKHLLVDEFQDTSRRQHELIAALVRRWKAGDGRTFFLVGDPMQSIYMFRQAEVELFDLVRESGLLAGGFPAKTLRLTTNFRSNAGVVGPLNAIFAAIFPDGAKPGSAAVAFLPGVASDEARPVGAFNIHPSFLPLQEAPPKSSSRPNGEASPTELAAESETAEVLEIVRRHLPAIAEAERRGEEFTVAVLGRARNHLLRIAAALRDAGIAFRAIELEKLGERQEILDLQSLTRALMHPMDRIAWLAALRAPWCGLDLRDLHLLCGADDRKAAAGPVARQIEANLHLLGEESRRRVERVVSVLDAALSHRYSQSSFAAWIERAWRSLGGAACVDAAGAENALAYFRMLQPVALDGIAAAGEAMKTQLNRLFASPDPSVGERCGVQLMTMHKAKGLGFHVVILPGLHRPSGRNPPALVRYLERATHAGSELLAAPIGNTGEDPSPVNRWVGRQKDNREAEERKRLLYVACTRALRELHLFGTATVTETGLSCPGGTLLQTAWPALEKFFQAEYASRAASQPSAPAENVIEFPRARDNGRPIEGVVETIAAGENRPVLYRLPLEWKPRPAAANVLWRGEKSAAAQHNEKAEEGERRRGSRSSRILGIAVHALFERAATLFEQGASAAEIRAALASLRRMALSIARNRGLPPQEAESLAGNAVKALEMALDDAGGRWILTGRREAQAESSWTGVFDGVSRELRIDRSFYAGPGPLSDGAEYLWIVDYKTASCAPAGVAEFLDRERQKHAPQLEGYAALMRLARGGDVPLRLGLYYPLLPKLVWWSPER